MNEIFNANKDFLFNASVVKREADVIEFVPVHHRI